MILDLSNFHEEGQKDCQMYFGYHGNQNTFDSLFGPLHESWIGLKSLIPIYVKSNIQVSMETRILRKKIQSCQHFEDHTTKMLSKRFGNCLYKASVD